MAWVSIHAPARGATRKTAFPACHTPVSIHAPARGATVFFDYMRQLPQVSIHAPARGATAEVLDCRETAKFQSTRPRGARQHVSIIIS